MTETNKAQGSLASEIARLEADPTERASLAAAQLASAIGALMEQTIDASTSSKQEIAANMGVTPARISQLLAGDGNVRIATVARLLDACGFEVSVTAKAKHGGQEFTVPRRSRPRRPGGTRQPQLACVTSPAEFYEPLGRIAQ